MHPKMLAAISCALVTMVRVSEAARVSFNQHEFEREDFALPPHEDPELMHKMENRQDCVYKESWELLAGSCTAKCGGGVATKVLQAREVLIPQDKWGYGDECPKPCTEHDSSGCGEKRYQACAEEPCLAECSTLDLGNHPTGAGVAKEWMVGDEKPQGECVFQFWKVLSEAPFRAQLLGETQPMGRGDAAVYEVAEVRRALDYAYEKAVTLHSGTEGGVVLGFRGCSLQSSEAAAAAAGGEPASSQELTPGTARTCLRARSAFRLSTQQQPIDAAQQLQLKRLERSTWKFPPELWRQAAAQEGVAMEASLPTGNWDRKALPFAVEMAPQAPPPVDIPKIYYEGEDVVLGFSDWRLDNGASRVGGHEISLRPAFSSALASLCHYTTLPICLLHRNDMEAAPCMAASLPDRRGNINVTLKHLPFARGFQASIAVKNEVGASRPRITSFRTLAGPGALPEECTVSHWTCEVEGDVEDGFPREGDAGCSLQGGPLPSCAVDSKFKPVSRKLKCYGKKYWRKCQPVMMAGDPSCVDAPAILGQEKAMQVCTHQPKENQDQPCELPGCSRSFTAQTACCCSPSAGTEQDSPDCACMKGKCESLGLVPAADSKQSCRH